MSNVKTAVSLPKDLFDKVDVLAEEMKVSRSGLLALAMEEFMERRQNRLLLEAINRAYENDAEDPEEADRLRQMRRLHRETVKEPWQSARETSTN